MSTEIHGFCDPRFTSMRDAFIANFEAGDELGASLALTHQGEMVVDLWAGFADQERRLPWARDTIVPVASTSKVAAAISLLMVIDRGLIELDAAVARYWPEFAQGGKEAVTVRDVLTHQAGVPGLDPPVTFEIAADWDAVIARLAAEQHWFNGKRRICYHANTFGFLAGELVRRVDGRRPRQFLHDEIAQKADVDFQIGLASGVDAQRVAYVIAPARIEFAPGIPSRVMTSFGGNSDINSTEFRSAEIPGGSGISNGRGIARLCAIVAMGGEWNGMRYLSKALVDEAGAEQADGKCPLMGPIKWGLGLALHNIMFPAPSPTSMHWGGIGGSWAVMDPKAQVSLGYAPNNFRFDVNEILDRRLARFNQVLQALLPTL